MSTCNGPGASTYLFQFITICQYVINKELVYTCTNPFHYVHMYCNKRAASLYLSHSLHHYNLWSLLKSWTLITQEEMTWYPSQLILKYFRNTRLDKQSFILSLFWGWYENNSNAQSNVIPSIGVQLATSPIWPKGYRKLCWAVIIFAFVARLAIRKVKF